MPDTAALLRGVPLFNELTEHDLERIARVAVPRTYPAGTIILREGDPGDTCYVLRAGLARVTRQHADGRSITLTNLGPGEIFGELAMFGGEVRSATVEAVDDVRAVALLAADLKRLLSEHPEIAVKLLGALSGRLREANARIVAPVIPEGLEPGGRRARRAGRDRGAAGRERRGRPADDVVVRSTQADIAQLAGTSREAASRFLATLQRAGVVTCKRGRVIVHDPAALHRYIY